MKYILKLEVYQIFFIVFIALIISWVEPYGIVDLILFFTFIFWLYAITTSGYRKFKFKNKGLYVFFTTNLIFMIIWIMAHTVFYPETATYRFLHNPHPDPPFLVLHYYSWFAFLFAIYLTSRVLGSGEHGKLAGFGKSYWYFIGFIFLFIGVWFIQPKARLLVEQEKDNEN
ncbi:MAG: hypothetical protein EA393_00125 [Bacteroidetes bacterium]|nr:MAG: hypothetical protein EA393_00125 [Bacteroidota bacterium]